MDQAIDIAAEERHTILELLELHLPGTAAWIFDSQATWASSPKSGLSLVVFTPPEKRPQVGDLREALEESDLPFRLDVFVWNDLPNSFRDRIHASYQQQVRGESCSGLEMSDIRLTDWEEYRFSDLCDITRGASPRPIHEWIAPSGIPWIKISDATANSSRYIERTREHIRLEGRRKSVTVFPGDLIVSNSATPGIPKFVNIEACIHDGWLLLRNFRGLDRLFGYYLLQQERSALVGKGTGSVFTNLKTELLKLHRVTIPKVSEQRTIAHILGTLDDKIELNVRMNATLEAMTQAMFKSWFVDYDPVWTKMEGLDTGLPKQMADLFPDCLVESEMGQIPKGWTVGTLGDIAASQTRGIDPAHVAEDTPYIGLQHMPRRSVALTEWGAAGNVSSRKSAFAAGDILFGKLRPYFHKVGIAAIDGICSTDIVVLNARMPKWSAFVLACVSSSDFVAHSYQTSTGTKMPRTSWQAMSTYKLCRPADAIVSEFQRVTSPMLGQIIRNVHESRTLAAFRDTLLPKLVSGKLRVRQSDKNTL